MVVIWAAAELPPVPLPPAPVVPVPLLPVVPVDVVEPVDPLVAVLPPAPLVVAPEAVGRGAVVASSPPHPQARKSATLEHRRTGRSEPKALAKLNIVQQCHGFRKRLNEITPAPGEMLRFRGARTCTALLPSPPASHSEAQ